MGMEQNRCTAGACQGSGGQQARPVDVDQIEALMRGEISDDASLLAKVEREADKIGGALAMRAIGAAGYRRSHPGRANEAVPPAVRRRELRRGSSSRARATASTVSIKHALRATHSLN